MAVNLVKGENRKLDLNKFRVGLGLLFVYITYFMNFATKLYMLIYE